MQFIPIRWNGYALLCEYGYTSLLKEVDKALPVLKEICKTSDLSYPESANTQRLGRIVVDEFGDGEGAYVDGYYIQREIHKGAKSSPIHIFAELKGEDLNEAYKELSDYLGFKYEDDWDNNTFDLEYSEWIEKGCPSLDAEAKDTKTYTVSLGCYYTNVAIYKIPNEDAEDVKAFVEENQGETCEALGRLQEWDDATFGDFECYSGEEDCMLSYINCSDFDFNVRDENGNVVAETEDPESLLPEYDFFVTDEEGLVIDVKIPADCPDWMRKMLETAKSRILKAGNVYVDGDANSVVNNYVGNFITLDMPEGMKVFCMHNLKGRHSAKIELPQDEEFDLGKLRVVHWSWDDLPNLGEFDGCPACGIIYGDKYYGLMCDSGDEKWSRTWIQDENWEILCEI